MNEPLVFKLLRFDCIYFFWCLGRAVLYDCDIFCEYILFCGHIRHILMSIFYVSLVPLLAFYLILEESTRHNWVTYTSRYLRKSSALELIYLNSSDRSYSNRRGVWWLLSVLLCFIESPVFNANSVDLDHICVCTICICPFSAILSINGWLIV